LKKAGIQARIPALKQGLNADQKQARLTFAEDHLNFDWSNVIFSDEKVFQNVAFVKKPLYRRKNTRYDEP
jgi:hypothetical protein